MRTMRSWRSLNSGRFRSVRKLDTVDLKIGNAGSYPMKITIMSSGATFGGGSCYVADEEVKTRFPEDCPKDSSGREISFKRETVILPKQSIRIIKASDQLQYNITTPSSVLPESFNNGQLLILAEKAPATNNP